MAFGSSLWVGRASDERRRVPASITFVSVEKETSARGRLVGSARAVHRRSRLRVVVRNTGLLHPINFRCLAEKPCKTAKFSVLLNVFPMSPVDVTAPFWVEKVLKTANFPNSRKARFFLSDGKRGTSASGFARFRPNRLQTRTLLSISVFCPGKLASSIPLSLSPLVTATSPLSFGSKKCAKTAKFPNSRRLRSSQDFPFFAQARQPAEVLAHGPTTCHRLRQRV